MARVVTAEDLRARLGRALDSLNASSDVIYVSNRGRLAGVLIDVDQYAHILDRLEFLEDGLAALQSRNQVGKSMRWSTVRSS